MKKIALFLMIVLMIFSLAACKEDESIYEPDLSDLPEIEGIDFEAEIEDFAEDSFNVHYLKEDEKVKHQHELFARTLEAQAYSSDESVATISDNGTITAKGKGTAYVMLVIAGSQCYLNKVVVGKTGIHLDNFGGIQDMVGLGFALVGLVFVGIVAFVVILVVKNVKDNRQLVGNIQNAIKQNQDTIPQYQAPQYQAPQYQAPQYQAPNTAGATRCASCGEELDGNSPFCPYCGHKNA